MENELEQARVKHEELEKELEQARVKQEELEKELEQARDVQNRLDVKEELARLKQATVQHVSFIRECLEDATTAAGAFQRLLEDAPVVTPEVVAPVEAVDQPVDSAAASAAAPVDSAEAPATPPFKAPPVKAPPGRHAMSKMLEMREMRGKAPPPGPGVASAVAPVGSAEAPAMPPVAVHLGVDAADPWEDGNPAAMNAPCG